MAVTQRDIAKALNLSHATVSFVLNDRRDVAIPEATRQRVLDMALQMGYVPNYMARALVSGRSQLVAVCMAVSADPNSSALLRAIVGAIQEKGYATLLLDHSQRPGRLPDEWPVDGVIAIDQGASPPTAGRQIPVVRIGAAEPSVDQIRIDMAPAYEECLVHLDRSGCRRLCFLSQGLPGDALDERAGLFCELADRHGFAVQAVGPESCLTTQADAIVCDHEEDAHWLQRHAYACGQSRRVVMTSARAGAIGFATILLPYEEVANRAVDRLVKCFANPLREPLLERIPARFVVQPSPVRPHLA